MSDASFVLAGGAPPLTADDVHATDAAGSGSGGAGGPTQLWLIRAPKDFDAAMLHKAKLDVVVDAAPGEEAARVAVQGDESVSLVATASAEAAQMVNLLPVRGKEGALRFGKPFARSFVLQRKADAAPRGDNAGASATEVKAAEEEGAAALAALVSAHREPVPQLKGLTYKFHMPGSSGAHKGAAAGAGEATPAKPAPSASKRRRGSAEASPAADSARKAKSSKKAKKEKKDKKQKRKKARTE